MQMVGTQNAHNLITSSTDGLVCSWLVDMLAQPQVYYTLLGPFLPLNIDITIGITGTHSRRAQQNRGSGHHHS
jgi:hypothetical protein